MIDSMHRMAAAITTQPGLHQVNALRDQKSGCLIGLAIWDSRDQWDAARPVMIAAVKDDPFDEWEAEGPEVFHLEVV